MSLYRAIIVAYVLALVALSVFSLNRYVILALFRRAQRAPKIRRPMPDVLPCVTLQLPIYNEFYVAARVIDSACRVDYPREKLQIQVLDDSTDETLALTRLLVDRWRAEGVWIEHHHRVDRTGYKAGALALGLEHAQGELVAVFDADFVIPSTFLYDTVQHFDEPDIGIVQTRWTYLNEDYSALTRATSLGLNGQFAIEQPAREQGGLFLSFNGTAGVLRASCIRDAGGWEFDTITEDLDLSYRAQMRGWRIRYLQDVTCPSEIPPDMQGLKAQQFRWTKGTQETARKLVPRLLRSDLDRWHKLQCVLHLTANGVNPFLLLVGILNPLAMLAAYRANVRVVWPLSIYFIFSLCGTFFYYVDAERALNPGATRKWLRRVSYFPMFLAASIGLSVSNARAAIEGLLGKATPFERTPKYLITQRGQRRSAARYRSRATVSTAAELTMMAYTFSFAIFAFHVREYAALPFLILFGSGYAIVGGSSVTDMMRGVLADRFARSGSPSLVRGALLRRSSIVAAIGLVLIIRCGHVPALREAVGSTGVAPASAAQSQARRAAISPSARAVTGGECRAGHDTIAACRNRRGDR
ncbi:MAG: glycosyltransferase [Gemmatimonadota bacterium]|nr:glycosyltransferase [Gemmatimonadota bacterium]